MGNTSSELYPQLSPRSGTEKYFKDGKIMLPIINLNEFMRESKDENSEKTFSITTLLAERGFVVIKVEDEISDETSIYHNFSEKATKLYRAGDSFFSQPLSTKNQYADPKNENKGYVNIDNLREYLKLRDTDHPTLDPKHIVENPVPWPSFPANLYENYSAVYSPLLELGWVAFKKLFDEANPQKTDKDLALLTDMRSCLEEKSSISIIHYFPTNSLSRDEQVSEHSNRLLRVDRIDSIYPQYEDLYSSKVVCSTHQDTGILTLIVASEVPGLQIFDKGTGVWIDVERVVDSKKYVILMAGQKISLFANSIIEPTIHRVWLCYNTHRTSMAFLFDIAKQLCK